jgi:carbonic anhydrase
VRVPIVAVAVLVLAAAACGGTGTTAAPAGGGAAEWKYGGELGPAYWASLDPGYALCGSGTAQSPVDLAGAQHAPASTLSIDYRPARFVTTDNGHTIEAEAEGGAGGITLGSTRYELVQFHFHAPSEHTVAGRHFPMELHLVNRAADGRLAVVGVLIREGKANEALADLLGHVPARGGQGESEADAAAILPAGPSYRYTGSLTTPPCTEDVRWIVMKRPIELSRDQILAFTHRYFGTDRPTRPLNGRLLALTG